jgi:nucleosome assembly protein 1-like 1
VITKNSKYYFYLFFYFFKKAEKIQGRLDIDFSIGQVLIEEVLPYSLEYYLGVKTLEGDDDGFEEEDIDEEDDEDDEDEEEDTRPKGKKVKK